jgi:iron-sulfur cluster repair protein YtfE (RIC family)
MAKTSHHRAAGNGATRPFEDPIALIEDQHDRVRLLFSAYGEGDRAALGALLDALALHLAIEETLVYPLLLEGSLLARGYESLTEHLSIKRLIADLIEGEPSDSAVFAARVRVLERQVLEHMEEEEREVLPALERRLGADARRRLGREVAAFMSELGEADSDVPLEMVLSTAALPP